MNIITAIDQFVVILWAQLYNIYATIFLNKTVSNIKQRKLCVVRCASVHNKQFSKKDQTLLLCEMVVIFVIGSKRL